MASVIREISIDAQADVAWGAVADVGNVHQRLVPGFVRDTQLADGVRTVTFASDVVIRETIVTVDAERRRLVYASVGGRAAHHNASIEVIANGHNSCQLVWTTDVLPDALASYILQNVETALPIMKRAIEAQAQGNSAGPLGGSGSA